MWDVRQLAADFGCVCQQHVRMGRRRLWTATRQVAVSVAVALLLQPADYDFYLALGSVFYSHSGQAALELGLDSGPVGSCCYACRFVSCLGVPDSQQQQHEKQQLQFFLGN